MPISVNSSVKASPLISAALQGSANASEPQTVTGPQTEGKSTQLQSELARLLSATTLQGGQSELPGLGFDEVVLRPLSSAAMDELAVQIITDSGLIASDERMQLVRHATAAGVALRRDQILTLDALWQQLDYAPAWLSVLIRATKNKLPPNKLSAMVMRQSERAAPAADREAFIYIYIDFSRRAPHFSLHPLRRERDETVLADQSDAAVRTILVGCDTPHLGPVLVRIATTDQQTLVEVAVMDEERRTFVATGLPELREQLLPLFRGLLLSSGLLPAGEVDALSSAPVTKRLDVRV